MMPVLCASGQWTPLRILGEAPEASPTSSLVIELASIPYVLGVSVIPAASWCDVVQELLDNWSDIKICLSNDTLLMKKNVNVVDLDSLLCSDRLGLPRLALLHVVLLCFRSNCKKQFESSVRDYGCRNFSQLPSIDKWSEYVSKPLNSWANVTVAECSQGEPSILKALRGLDESPRRSFLRECQGCLLELLKQLSSSPYAHSLIARSLSSLSVDMLLGGTPNTSQTYSRILLPVCRSLVVWMVWSVRPHQTSSSLWSWSCMDVLWIVPKSMMYLASWSLLIFSSVGLM